IAVRWWKPHSGTRLARLVGPPRDRGGMWWMSQAEAGWSQPGKAQCGWRVVAARRRWAGMVSVAVPMSRGRLGGGIRGRAGVGDGWAAEAGAQRGGEPVGAGEGVGGRGEQGAAQPVAGGGAEGA